MKKLNSKKLKYGSASTVFTVLFIAVVIVLNIVVGLLGDRFMIEFDMTQSGFFDLSDATTQALDELKDDITITVIDSQDFTYTNNTYSSSVDSKYLDAFPELFKRYEHFSNGRVKVQYLDPYTNPTALQQYKELGEISATNVIVEGPYRSILLSSKDFFVLETDNESSYYYTQQYVTGLQAEQKLTSAISYVTAEQLLGARFVQGHGESALTALSTMLKDGNYDVGDINLSLEDIDDTIGLLVIASPTADYSADEINKLDAFFDRGGNAIILFDPNTPVLSNLALYLREWGVSYERAMVLDSQRAISYQTNIVADVAPHDVTGPVISSGVLTVSPNSLPIDVLWETEGWRTTTVLLTSSTSSYSRLLSDQSDSLEKQVGDAPGPFNVAVLSEHEDPNNKIYSKIFFATTYTVMDSLITSDTYGNKKLYTSLMSYFGPTTDPIYISAKSYSTSVLTIQSWQAQTIFYILVVILPLAILGAGLAVWIRRRNM